MAELSNSVTRTIIHDAIRMAVSRAVDPRIKVSGAKQIKMPVSCRNTASFFQRQADSAFYIFIDKKEGPVYGE